MTEPESTPARVRIVDLFRPRRLFRGILAQPSFVFPVVVFVTCFVLYSQLAV